MKEDYPHATNDAILSQIHVLWERGWIVDPQTLQIALHYGSHAYASQERLRTFLTKITEQEKELWLLSRNQQSLQECQDFFRGKQETWYQKNNSKKE